MNKVRHIIFLSLLVLLVKDGFPHQQRVYTDGINTEHVLPGHIIFKLTPAATEKIPAPGMLPESLQALLDNEKSTYFYRLFPAHEPPAQKYHRSGKPYSDLSLIYQLYTEDHSRIEELMYAIAETGYVEYVQPRHVPYLFWEPREQDVFIPNDTLVPDQYHLERVSAFQAWAVWKGDTNYVVGIVDTGIDLLHPDLVDAIKYNYDDPVNGEDSDGDGYVDNFYGWDLGEGNNDPSFNRSAHGLHVSGIAAATTDNITGVAGTGFKTKFLPVKIDDEFGRLTKAYEGIVYAADQGVSVINCSWGSHFYPGPFGQDIIDYAVLNRDVLVVAAAGNANTSVPFYPTHLNNVLSVAATDTLDIKTHFSTFGPFVDIAAPGTRILSTWVYDGYAKLQGTSMASPVVAGAAALLRSYYPEMDALQTKGLLKMTSDPIDHLEGNENYINQLGYGRLNMYRALTETGHPYITIAEKLWTTDETNAIRPGQEFSLSMLFNNRLAPANGVYAIMKTNSDHLLLTTDSVMIGYLGTGELVNISETPFKISALQSLPLNYEPMITTWFYDSQGNSIGRKSFTISLNSDYLNVVAGRIATTISARGAIGYNYPNLNQGYGLRFNDGFTRVRSAGLILANSANAVADNVYGAAPGSYSATILPISPPEMINNHPAAPILVKGSIRDQQPGLLPPLDVIINYYIYFWDDDPAEDFFIIRYFVINKSGKTLNNLYGGFFADWVLRDVKHHRAKIEIPARLAYSYAANGGHFSGIQLLTQSNMHHYAFDNQGAQGSMQIDNGFTDFKKYTALTSNRFSAGYFSNDNNISSLISSGPHSILPGDTLEIAFALHLTDDFEDMLQNTSNANLRYLQLIDIETSLPEISETQCPEPFIAYPNPFTEKITVELCRHLKGSHQLKLFDLQGNVLEVKEINADGVNAHIVEIKPEKIYTGIYILYLQGQLTGSSLRVLKIPNE